MPFSWARRADRVWTYLVARTPFLADRPAPRKPRPLGVEHLEDRLTPVAYAYTISGADWDPNFVITIRGLDGVQVHQASSFNEYGEPYAIFQANEGTPGLYQGYWFADLDMPNGYKIFSITHPVLNADGNVYNTRAFVSREELDVTSPPCVVCPTPVIDLSPRRAEGNLPTQPAPDAVSPVGVGYEDGTPHYSEADLTQVGEETPFGQSRDWSSRTARDAGSSNGNNWVNPLPQLLKRPDQDKVFVTGTGSAATTFRKAAYTLDDWRPTLSDHHSLAASPGTGEYKLTDEVGDKYTFYDASPVIRWTWGYGDENGRLLARHDYLRADSGFSADESFTIPVAVAGGARKVSLYMADFDRNRSQRVELVDAATDAVLDTRDVAGFSGGEYLSWNVSGSAYFRVTKLAGSGAGPRVTGVFFDPAGGAAGAYQGEDDATKGTWRGAYGADGHLLASGSTIPSYATVSVVGAPAGFYTNATDDVRAVQRHAYDPDAQAWSSLNTVDVTVAQPAGQSRKVSLYFVDPANAGLGVQVQVLDAATGAVLDTRVVRDYLDGKYASWNVTGPVTLRVTRWGGNAARVSGVFLDAASGPDGYLGEDAATRGAWRGAYGADGHALPSGQALPAGTQVTFTNATPPERVGRLKSYETAAGERLDVTQYTARGEPAEVRRTRGGVVEAWSYAYGTTLQTAGTLRSVTFSRSADGGLTWAAVQSVAYEYYGDGDANGNRNDLRSAVVRDGGPAAPVLRTSYYRYYKPDDPNGLTGQLKYVVTDASFRRLSAATGATLATLDALTDAQVGVYADKYYQYYTWDFAGYVKTVVAQGEGCSACTNGEGTYHYDYARNPRHNTNEQDGDYYPWMANTWYLKTTETLSDGNQNVVYTNPTGQAMLNVFVDAATGRQWPRFTEFDAGRRVTRTAGADAVTGYSEASDDLLHQVDGNYEFLSDSAGEVTEYTFGPALTATASVPGDVPGYRRDVRLRHGETGTPVLQSRTRYFTRAAGPTAIYTPGSDAVYPVASETRYPGTGPNTPLYADGFDGPSIAAVWSFSGGTWGQAGGAMSQTSAGNSESNKAFIVGRTWRAEQEVVSSVRIDTWDGGNYAWAGVGVRHDPATGRGMSLVFNGADTVRFYREYSPFGASLTFPWQVGVWYRVRVRVEPGRDGDVLLAKVWEAGQPEPAGWMLRQAAWGDLPGGGPALLGGVAYSGYGYMTASFDDFQAEGDEPPGDVFGRAYTWFDGAGESNPFQAKSVTVTAPAVSAAKNGSGVASQATTVYDALGRPVWVRDAGGFLHYTAYDPATGAVAVQIDDVDAALTADFTGLPAGWATPAGGGKHRRTVDTLDRLGRVVKTTSAAGRAAATAYPDGDREVRSYPGWDGSAATGPVSLSRFDGAGGAVTVNGQTLQYSYSEELTYDPASVPVDGQGQPTGAEAVANIKSLTRVYYSQSGQAVWRDDYFDLAGLTYLGSDGKPNFALGAAGVHFLRTTYGYDHRGRRNRVQAPDGSITRTVYDGLDRVVSVWRGADDTPASGWWSPSNPAGMAQVSESEYDGGGVGAGDLTRMVEKPGGGAADRVTVSGYDWRHRPVAVKQGAEAVEAADVNRPFATVDYDNLDRATRTRVYDGDGVPVADADADGAPDLPAAGLLRRQSETLYDPLDRAYRDTVWGANQATGALTPLPAVADTWYDQRGNAIKVRAPGGLAEKRTYDGLGQLTLLSRTDAGGDAAWADAGNTAGDVVWAEAANTYDADGNLSRVAHKARGQGETGTGPLGDPVSGVRARVTYAAAYYDSADRPIATVDVGTAGATAWDAGGGTPWTRPTTVPARSDAVLVTSTSYDAAGRVSAVTSPGGLVTGATYDLLGRPLTGVVGQGTADARTTASAYNALGQLVTVTAPGSRVTRFAYDGLGRATGVTAADGTAVARTTMTAYDQLDEAVTATAPAGTPAAPTTATTRVAYDVLGRPVDLTLAAATALAHATATRYDVFGRAVAVEEPGGFTTTTAYDDAARAVTVTDPAGGSTVMTFDVAGNRTAVTDALGHATTTAYDLLNRPTTVTDPNAGVTHFEYNTLLKSDVVVDPRGNRTATVYDRLDRVGGTVDPFGLATVVSRDRDGRPVSVVDRLGRERRFGYDGVGRETSEAWYAPAGTAPVQTQTYGYDAAGNLSSATDPDGDYAIVSDALNRPVTASTPSGVAFTFGYDLAGNRSSATDNKGATQASAYDLLGRLVSRTLHTGGGDARVDLAYDARGLRSSLSRSADLAGTQLVGSTETGRDGAGRVTGLTHKGPTGATVLADTYAYDLAGRLTGRTEGGASETVGYDAGGQLTTSAAGSYTYDLAGNRTTAGVVTSAVGNRLLSDGVWSYTYDAEGQLTKKSRGASAETWTYGYDHRDQMVWAERRATDGGTLLARVEYAYDAFGNRVRRVERDGALAVVSDERFALDGWDTAKPAGAVGTEAFDAWADLSGSGSVTAWRLFGPGHDEVLARVATAGGTGWYLRDRQGSVQAVLDAAGAVAGTRAYAVFGAIISQTGAGFDRYGYTGRELDGTLALQYSRARLYDPASGRFTGEDPLGLAAGDTNIYRYVGNAPTNATDPSGMFELWDRFVNGTEQLADRFANGAERVAGPTAGYVARNPLQAAGDALEGSAKSAEAIGNTALEIGRLPIDAAGAAITGGLNAGASVGGFDTRFHYNPSSNLGKAIAAADTPEKQREVAAAAALDSVFGAWSLGTALGNYAVDGDEEALGAALSAWGTGNLFAGGALKAQANAAARAAALEAHINRAMRGVKPPAGQKPACPVPNAGKLFDNCFPADTAVRTEHGLRPIQEILAKDRVWAFDHVIGEWQLCRVIEAFRREHTGNMVAATVNGEVIESTDHHPWWVVRGETLDLRPRPEHVPGNPDGYNGGGRWVDAIDLRVGDILLAQSGEQVSITSLVVWYAQLPVYNFHVEDLHCYAVGSLGVLVHNNSIAELAEALRNGRMKEKDLKKLGLSPDEIAEIKKAAADSRPRAHDAAKIIDDITGSEKAVANALEKARRSPGDATALEELERAISQLDGIRKAQDEIRRRDRSGDK